jgi:hypothetical protein
MMMTLKKYSNKHLSIEVAENQTSIDVKWDGKSIDREPSKFISPILVKVLEMAGTMNKRITMDFQSLSYMNSSTITPIIKILERAKKGMTKITILYRKSLKWQELNFSALEVFRTDDNRLQIKGL